MIKTLVLILIAGLLGGTGHVMLAKGMKTIGDLTEAPSSRLGGMVGRVVSNPWVLFGVALQASFFFLYLTLLSRAERDRCLERLGRGAAEAPFIPPGMSSEKRALFDAAGAAKTEARAALDRPAPTPSPGIRPNPPDYDGQAYTSGGGQSLMGPATYAPSKRAAKKLERLPP